MDADSKILVTGASGLIGTHLVNTLLNLKFQVTGIIHNRPHYFDQNENLKLIKGDLTDNNFCQKICQGIDYIFHLAVETGSIVKNAKHPASIMTPTILMDFNMLKAAHEENVKGYLYCSCACVYPAELENMTEENAWVGPPPEMHKTISWSKRIAELQCQSFYKEFGDKISIVRPSNTYGPYDVFDIENSHVISAFIKKVLSKTDPFIIWGTGEQIREFVYAEDIAKGMILAINSQSNAEPINLGGGEAIKIKDLAKKIMLISKHEPEIKYDKTKPSGHMKRVLNSKKAKKELGFLPSTSLDEGLQKTIKWYQKKQNDLDAN